MTNGAFRTRRSLLFLTGTAVAGSLAGCLGGGGSEAEEARKAAERLFIRIRDGDIEGANEVIADDGPLGNINESVIEDAGYVNVEAETVVIEDESAVVRATLIYESDSPDESEVGVRKVDGEWLVWEQLRP